jgi:hypothetical protein
MDGMAAEKDARTRQAEPMAQTVVPHLAGIPLRTLRDTSPGP